MRAVVVVVAILPVGFSVPAQAQVAPREFSSFIASAPAPAPAPARRSLPSQAKWGMIVGGVTGTALGAILVSNSPCKAQGWGCLLRPILVLGGAAAGGLVGMLVGGVIGYAIAGDGDVDVAASGLRVGVRLSL